MLYVIYVQMTSMVTIKNSYLIILQLSFKITYKVNVLVIIFVNLKNINIEITFLNANNIM